VYRGGSGRTRGEASDVLDRSGQRLDQAAVVPVSLPHEVEPKLANVPGNPVVATGFSAGRRPVEDDDQVLSEGDPVLVSAIWA
jgi:hypothetical protein